MRQTIITIEVDETRIVTGDDLAEVIEQARKMVVYNMGPEPARSTAGPIYERLDLNLGAWTAGKQIGTWTVKL